MQASAATVGVGAGAIQLADGAVEGQLAVEGHALGALGGLVANGVVPFALDGLDDLSGRGVARNDNCLGQDALDPSLLAGGRALLAGQGLGRARVVRHQGAHHDAAAAGAQVGAHVEATERAGAVDNHSLRV